jgi:hypothetical protein
MAWRMHEACAPPLPLAVGLTSHSRASQGGGMAHAGSSDRLDELADLANMRPVSPGQGDRAIAAHMQGAYLTFPEYSFSGSRPLKVMMI